MSFDFYISFILDFILWKVGLSYGHWENTVLFLMIVYNYLNFLWFYNKTTINEMAKQKFIMYTGILIFIFVTQNNQVNFNLLKYKLLLCNLLCSFIALFVKKKHSVVFLSSKTDSKWSSFINTCFFLNINDDSDYLKQELSQSIKIYLDSIENYEKACLLAPKNTQIYCLDNMKLSIMDEYWNYKLGKKNYKNYEVSNSLEKNRVLIFGNEYLLILNFIDEAIKMNATEIVVLTDSISIKEKTKNITKSILINSSSVLNELDLEHNFDIIFDAYILQNHNLNNYRIFLSGLVKIIKNKQAFVGISKQTPFLEGWLFSSFKEYLLKNIISGIKVRSVVLRVGEYSSNTFLPDNISPVAAMHYFSLQDVKDIVMLSWKAISINNHQKSCEILSSVHNRNQLSTLNFLKMFENFNNIEIETTTCENYNISKNTELINTCFFRHELQENHLIKNLLDSFLQNQNITSESILSALLSFDSKEK